MNALNVPFNLDEEIDKWWEENNMTTEKFEKICSNWQIQEVRRRDAEMMNNPACMLDFDLVISELEKAF